MNRKLAIIYVVPLVLLLVPFVVSAAVSAIHSNVWDINTLKGPLVICTGTGSGTTPACDSLCDLFATFANFVYFFIAVVIWIVSPIMIAWAGILFMLARGSPEKTGSARKMITGVVIGILIVISAYLIVSVFVSTIGIAGIGGFSNPTCTVTANATP